MIVCCGEALIDLFPSEDPTVWHARPGGSPLNVAVGLGRLGVPAGLLARLSEDRFGDMLRRHLIDSEVAPTYLSRGPEPSALAVVEPGAADREPGFTFHGEGSADRALRAEDAQLGPEVEIVHLAGSVSAVLDPSAEVLTGVLRSSRGRRLVSIDPNVRPTIAGTPQRFGIHLRRWLGAADVVKVSQADLAWLEPDRQPEEVAARWLRDGPVLVVVTRGGQGSVAVSATARVEVPAAPAEVVDTVGAGDAFMSGLLAWLHERGVTDRLALGALDAAALAEALAFAGRVAAITSSRQGADPPRRHELD